MGAEVFGVREVGPSSRVINDSVNAMENPLNQTGTEMKATLNDWAENTKGLDELNPYPGFHIT